LQTTRDMLRLVGFSDKTCQVGLSIYGGGTSQQSVDVVGGQCALLDETEMWPYQIQKRSLIKSCIDVT
jgi:hypothetical protein